MSVEVLATTVPGRTASDGKVEGHRHYALNDRDLSSRRPRRTMSTMRNLSAAAKECPIAPPEQASVQARALHRACLILGGVGALARRLEVGERDVEQWVRGEIEVPERAFLFAVELILLHASPAGSRN
jgi:hypothetical protein